MNELHAGCAALAGTGEHDSPWLAPYLAAGLGVAQDVMRGATVAQALNAALREGPVALGDGRPLCFVPQAELPAGEAYEAFIARNACVPTRDNLHDLFNGLVWLSFPALKRRLNQLQAHQIAQHGVQPQRGAVRDALTLFDENAALLQAPAVLVDALRRRDWHTLFVTHRPAWQGATLTVFGHALLEKLTRPRKAITAHVWVLPEFPVPPALPAPLDGLADLLSPEWLSDHPHCPLPVLGVPGWWPANAYPGFYADASVFRPGPLTPGPLNSGIRP